MSHELLPNRPIDRVPDYTVFRGYEYTLSKVYQEHQEGIARFEAYSIRNGGSLGCAWGYTKACVKRVVVDDLVFWAVYARGD